MNEPLYPLRACLKIRKGAVFSPRAGWRGATKENILYGSSTEEQRSQPACGEKTLRAAGLLPVGFAGSALTARCGDTRTSPPRPQPKSLAAAPFPIFRQALNGVARDALLSSRVRLSCPSTGRPAKFVRTAGFRNFVPSVCPWLISSIEPSGLIRLNQG
jgi:hypothetical protein